MQTIRQFFIRGRVQGVAFRFFTQQAADEIGLSGYVRNLSDGRVEVVAAGNAGQIESIRQWLQKGPRTARVDQVEEFPYTGTEHFHHFSIR